MTVEEVGYKEENECDDVEIVGAALDGERGQARPKRERENRYTNRSFTFVYVRVSHYFNPLILIDAFWRHPTRLVYSKRLFVKLSR